MQTVCKQWSLQIFYSSGGGDNLCKVANLLNHALSHFVFKLLEIKANEISNACVAQVSEVTSCVYQVYQLRSYNVHFY